MITPHNLLSIGVLFLVIIAVFLIFREAFTWYWKINELVKLQREQNEALKAIFQQLGGTISNETEIEKKARLYDQDNS